MEITAGGGRAMAEVSAVIQAGGEGTRLEPYSTVLPKALMPIGDSTIIEGLLDGFLKAGIKQIYITVGRHSHLIRSFCGDGSRWGVSIEYVEESQPLGSIGPLSNLRDELTETFFVANSDVWCDADINSIYATHTSSGSILTIVAASQDVPIDYGVVEAANERLSAFREKPVERFLVSTGIYCMEPRILQFVPDNAAFGLDGLVFSLMAKGEPITIYKHAGRWIDIGRIDDLRRAQQQMAEGIRSQDVTAGGR